MTELFIERLGPKCYMDDVSAIIESDNMSQKSGTKLDNTIPQSGEAAILSKWVDEHYDYLFKYAYRYFKSREKAEELLQDTFLAATQALSRFEGKSSPRTWLAGILRHKIMDVLKEKSKNKTEQFDFNDEAVMSKCFDHNEHWTAETGPLVWGYSPDQTLSQKQFFITLENCMSKLPEKVRQIFILREVEGYNREEISKKLNFTSTNTGVILHRARIMLQQCLQTNWFQANSGEKI